MHLFLKAKMYAGGGKYACWPEEGLREIGYVLRKVNPINSKH